jgi:hypothetical protein
MAKSIQQRLAGYNALADALLKTHPSSGLIKSQKKSYVVLERVLTNSTRNKNAISVIREGVSFMVPDVEAELAGKPSHLKAARSESFPRLQFTGLDVNDVEANKDYFVQLIEKAKLQSEELQRSKKF